jgi:hypothetical protein
MNDGYVWTDAGKQETHVSVLTDAHLINIVRWKLNREIFNAFAMNTEKWQRFAGLSQMNYALLMQLRIRELSGEFAGLDNWFIYHENELYIQCLQEIAKSRKSIGFIQAVLQGMADNHE